MALSRLPGSEPEESLPDTGSGDAGQGSSGTDSAEPAGSTLDDEGDERQPTGKAQEVIRAMASLEAEEMEQVLTCAGLRNLYQVRKITSIRRNGKMVQVLGPVLGQERERGICTAPRLATTAVEEEEQGRAADEGVEEGVPQAEELTVPEEGPSGQDDAQPVQDSVRETVMALERLDDIPMVPSTGSERRQEATHHWKEMAAPTMGAMNLLRVNHPSIYRTLREQLSAFQGRGETLGNRICTLAETLAGEQSLYEVSEDLRRTLEYHSLSRRGAGAGESEPSTQLGDLEGQWPGSGQGQELMGPGVNATPRSLGQQLIQLLQSQEIAVLYGQIEALDASRYAQALKLRVHLANLAQLFDQEVSRTRPVSGGRPDPWHKSGISNAKDKLFSLVMPGADRREANWATEAGRFERRLERGRRWLSLCRAFGWGVLVMVPGGFPESRWHREVGSEALEEIFFGFVKLRYPRWFNPDRALAILLGVMNGERLPSAPRERVMLEDWVRTVLDGGQEE